VDEWLEEMVDPCPEAIGEDRRHVYGSVLAERQSWGWTYVSRCVLCGRERDVVTEALVRLAA
jgi:hypothetical protein